MAKAILDGSQCVVKVCLENNTAGLTHSATVLDADDKMSVLYDDTDQNCTLYTVPMVESVSFDAFENEIEEFQTLDNNYLKRRTIRQKGGITITFVAFDSDDTADPPSDGTVDAFNWEFAALNYQFGATTSGAGAASYKALDDTAGGTLADDMGWGVELGIKNNGGTEVLCYRFHNCTLSLSREVGFNKAQRLTAKFDDARLVEVINGTTATDHAKA